MLKERQDSLLLLSLGSVFFVLVGGAIAYFNTLGMIDFKEFYFGAKCLVEHHDPYQQSQLWALYKRDAGDVPSTLGSVLVASHGHLTPNFPTTFFLVAPLALMPLKFAGVIWFILSAAAFVLAAFATWNAGAEFTPLLAGALVFLFLVNSEMLLALGNTVGLVVGLSVIAVWCFLQNRFTIAGTICLAIALVMKPHDVGLIWLYFLFAGGMARKRALETLIPVAALVVPAVLWTSQIAPHWLVELQANQSALMQRGALNDPGPHSGGSFGVNMTLCLQTIVSRFWDNPHFYNPVVYLICGALLLIWLRKTLQIGFSPRLAWFAIAVVAPLTILVVYHRSYDARLLLLSVPACAMLWQKGGRLGWCALALTLVAIILTGDIFWIVVFQITHYSGPSLAWGVIPAPLILLALSVFYLYVYVRRPGEALGGIRD
jgi:hypothetical protein